MAIVPSKTNDLDATQKYVGTHYDNIVKVLPYLAEIKIVSDDVAPYVAEILTVGEDALEVRELVDEFQGQYFGELAADPTEDPLGNPVTAGDLYFNTNLLKLRYYDGTNWVSFSVNTAQDFTSADVVGTTLSITHGFGSEYVWVTIYDQNSAPILVNWLPKVGDETTDVDIDLSELTITGTWKVIVSNFSGTISSGGDGGGVSLGETNLTAHRGDHGKTAYDHSQEVTGNPHSLDTDDVTEATNEYYTEAKVSANTNVALNSTHRGLTHAPSDAEKNSDILQAEIEAKLVGTLSSHDHTVSQSDVGLSDVDNTADSAKPVSTAQQTALDLKINNSEKGSALGVAELDGSGTVPAAQLPNSVKNGIRVIGFWNANTNTPDISALSLSDGEAYQVSVSGSTSLNGETNWKARDLVVWEDGLAGNWFKIDNTDEVLSVNSQTGAVTLTTSNIPEGTNEYYTEAKVSANSNVSANTAKETNASHSGEVTGDTTLTIANNAVVTNKIANSNVTLAKLADIATARIMGRITASSGVQEELTAAQVRTLLELVIGTDVQQDVPLIALAGQAAWLADAGNYGRLAQFEV